MTNDPPNISNSSDNKSKIHNESEFQEGKTESISGLNKEMLNDRGRITMEIDLPLKVQMASIQDDISSLCNETHVKSNDKNIPSINNCDHKLMDIDLNDKCNINSESSITDKEDLFPSLLVRARETESNNIGPSVDLINNMNSSALHKEVIEFDTRQTEEVHNHLIPGIFSSNCTINENSSSPSLHSNLKKDSNCTLSDVQLTTHDDSKENFNHVLLDFSSEQNLERKMPGTEFETSTTEVSVVSLTVSSEGDELISCDNNKHEFKLDTAAKPFSESTTISELPNEVMNCSKSSEHKSPGLSNETTNIDYEIAKSSSDLKEKIGNSIKSIFENNEHLNLLEKQNIASLQSNTLKKVNNLFSSIKSYKLSNFRTQDEPIADAKQETKLKTCTLQDGFQNNELLETLNRGLNHEQKHHRSEGDLTQSQTLDSRHGPTLVSPLATENTRTNLKQLDLPHTYVLNSELIHTVKSAVQSRSLQENKKDEQEKLLSISDTKEVDIWDKERNRCDKEQDWSRNDCKKSVSLDSSPVKQSRYYDVQDELYLLKETNIRLLAEISKLEQDSNKVRKEFRTYREEAELFKQSMNEQLIQHESWREQNRLVSETEARSHAAFRRELEAKIDKLKKDFELANKEKEASVMRYVTKESELITARHEKETIEKKCKDLSKEKDNVLGKLKVMSTEKARLTQLFDDKCTEYNILQRSVDKLTDEVTGKDIKLKWVQSKLDNELETSRALAEKLGAIEMQHVVQADEQTRLKYSEDSQRLLLQEIDVLKKKLQILTEENNALSLKVQRLEKERLESDEILSNCKSQVNSQNETICQLRNQLANMEDLKYQLNVEHERVVAKDSEVEQIQLTNCELSQDMATCRAREAELLQFTEKLTAKNVRLQSEFSALEAKAENLEKNVAPLNARISKLESELRELHSQLDAERVCKEGDNKALARVVAERSKQLEVATKEIEELKSENQIMKRKHTTTVRELNKELALLKKKAESFSLTNGDAHSDSHTIGSGSRASSCQSLNEANVHHSPTGASIASSLSSTLQLEPDRNVMIERLVELQRSHARVIEKAEFLEEHNAQLVAELQKKTKILQNYILREESGALISRTMDVNKAEVSKHGGIMASLYSSKPVDSGMTLDLSLEINQKLQAVLEDTILKNITLKENIDTLGEHIEHLSKKS